MASYRNTSGSRLAFRDDSGKRFVAAGQEFSLVGDQHAAHVSRLPGVVEVQEPVAETPAAPERTVVELRARADELGVAVSSDARKADLEAAVATAEANA